MCSHDHIFVVKVTRRLATTAVSSPSDVFSASHSYIKYVGVTVGQNSAQEKLNWGCALFEKHLYGQQSHLVQGSYH